MIHFINEQNEVTQYDDIMDALDNEVFFDNVIIVDFDTKRTLIYNDKGVLEKEV